MSTVMPSNLSPTENLIHYGIDFAPRLIVKARGAVLWDAEGREFLDFTSGQMCATLGHNHPRIIEAIRRACDGALHLYSGFLSPPVVALSRRLAAMLPPRLSKSLFLSTGAEVNEAAVKLAKLHTGRFEIIALQGSWHGMSSGALSVNYVAGRKGYGPLMPGSLMLPAPNSYNCPIRHCRDCCDMTCLEVGFEMVDNAGTGAGAAVIAEPVASSGGVVVPPPGYWQRMRQHCDRRGLLLIFDEAQTAFGRLGRDFAFQHFGVEPDILTLSKTLGGGLPLAATVTSTEIAADCHEKGFVHITSHVSDPLPAEVALAVLDVLKEEKLNERAIEMGQILTDGLRFLQRKHEIIGDVRGLGLLQGVELVKDRETREPHAEVGRAITRRCMELGLSMNIVAVGKMAAVWRIAPPLTVTRAELERGVAIIDQAIGECVAGRRVAAE
jgi:2,2-dialkylglycine decarboxylase (pyruvate)